VPALIGPRLFASAEVFPASSASSITGTFPIKGSAQPFWVRLPWQAYKFGVIFIIGRNYVYNDLGESPLQSANINIQHKAKLWQKANNSLPLEAAYHY
jgi:hypothetical protein